MMTAVLQLKLQGSWVDAHGKEEQSSCNEFYKPKLNK